MLSVLEAIGNNHENKQGIVYNRREGDATPLRKQPYKVPGWRDLRLRQWGDFSNQGGVLAVGAANSHPASLCTCRHEGINLQNGWCVSVGKRGRPAV